MPRITSILSPRVVVMRLPSVWSRHPPFVWSLRDSFTRSCWPMGALSVKAPEFARFIKVSGGAGRAPSRLRVSSVKPWMSCAKSSPVADGAGSVVGWRAADCPAMSVAELTAALDAVPRRR